jgi:two-component system sensor histidine kinase YesM
MLSKKNNRLMVNEIENPINDLKKMSDAIAQNHLEYRIQNYPQNELGKLSESMNTMAEQLNVLMAENALKQYNLAQSELRTLQSQITPHFIYNSLDAIISLASLGELDLVQKMTYALSDFFRISLSKGRDFILSHDKSHFQQSAVK